MAKIESALQISNTRRRESSSFISIDIIWVEELLGVTGSDESTQEQHSLSHASLQHSDASWAHDQSRDNRRRSHKPRTPVVVSYSAIESPFRPLRLVPQPPDLASPRSAAEVMVTEMTTVDDNPRSQPSQPLQFSS